MLDVSKWHHNINTATYILRACIGKPLRSALTRELVPVTSPLNLYKLPKMLSLCPKKFKLVWIEGTSPRDLFPHIMLAPLCVLSMVQVPVTIQSRVTMQQVPVCVCTRELSPGHSLPTNLCNQSPCVNSYRELVAGTRTLLCADL